jgi:hypothetical protein
MVFTGVGVGVDNVGVLSTSLLAGDPSPHPPSIDKVNNTSNITELFFILFINI